MSYQTVQKMTVSSSSATQATLVPAAFAQDPHQQVTNIVITWPAGAKPAEVVLGADVLISIAKS